jgi:taurine dioxygenase
VRAKEITPEDHDRFVGYFGPLQAQRAGDGAGYVTNREIPQRLFPRLQPLLWHNDGAYGPRPGIATSLWAIDVSPLAAPTMFANAVEVVDRLDAGLRQRAETLRIVNVRDTAFDRTYERVPLEELMNTDEPDRYVTYEHPVLYDPPHLDHKAVIASEHMTSHVVDLPSDEGDAFLQELYAQLYSDDNVYSHYWQPGDLIIWDNIALHHARPEEVGDIPRHLRRQCIDGWYTEDGDVLDWTFTRVKVRAAPQM